MASATMRGSDIPLHVTGLLVGLILLALAYSQAASATKQINSNEPMAPSASEILNENQRRIIEAVKGKEYDEVVRLATQAKQQAEYEQVAKEMLIDGPMAGWSREHAVRMDAFFSSLMMILVSELGDKTFFIAAVMAMKHSRGVVLAGALGALALMTLLSAAAGFALPNLIPRTYTHYASVVLFFVFGFKLLKDAREMADGGGPSEELEEVEAELNMADKKKNPDIESGGVVGHTICTGLAVTGGRMLASRISEKTVSYSGGFLFLLFALHGLWQGGSALNNA